MNSLEKVEITFLKEYANIISDLHKQFENRFKDFEALEPQFHLFSIPFAVDTDKVSEDMKMELVELQSDIVLKQKYMDIGVPEFYKFLSRDKFPKLLSEFTKIMTMFGSTYICQQVSSFSRL